MRKKQFNYKWALWVIVIVLLMRILFFCIYYYTVKNYSRGSENKVNIVELLDFWVWVFPVLYIGEGIVYFLLRKRNINRSFVNVHLRCLLFENIIFPFFIAILAQLLSNFLSEEQYQSNMALFGKGRLVIIWAVFIIGHIFFVLAIVKSFNSQKEELKEDEPDGFLDEFADRQ